MPCINKRLLYAAKNTLNVIEELINKRIDEACDYYEHNKFNSKNMLQSDQYCINISGPIDSIIAISPDVTAVEKYLSDRFFNEEIMEDFKVEIIDEPRIYRVPTEAKISFKLNPISGVWTTMSPEIHSSIVDALDVFIETYLRSSHNPRTTAEFKAISSIKISKVTKAHADSIAKELQEYLVANGWKDSVVKAGRVRKDVCSSLSVTII